VRGEYLLWALKEGHLPPLVTTGATAAEGVLGRSGTSVLIGDADAHLGTFSGGRFTGGVWAGEDDWFGVEGSYFFMPEQTAHYDQAGGPGLPLLAAPFVDSRTGREGALLLNGSGRTGGVAIDVDTGFQGGDADLVFCVASDPNYRIELLTGFRYLGLDDSLEVRDALAIPHGVAHGGTRMQVTDEFDTRNHFYGGKVEGRGEYHWLGFVAEALVGISFGGNAEFARVNGGTISELPRPPRRFLHFPRRPRGPREVAAGLLAQPTNTGEFYAGEFGVVPELGLTVGYQVCRNVRIFAGYSFLYWSGVARAGDQIDRTVDPAHIPVLFPSGHAAPATRPEFSFHQTDFWAQGGTFGVQFDY
jgi:hypothetical protein